MSRLLIFTTGASLLQNLQDPQKQFNRPDIARRYHYAGNDAWFSVFNKAERLRQELIPLAELFAPLNLNNPSDQTRATAEIASLHHLQPQPDDQLIFLCSDTGRGAYSALFNALLLTPQVHLIPHQSTNPPTILSGFTNLPDLTFHSTLEAIRHPQIQIRTIKKLNPHNAEQFTQTALPNLIHHIATLHYNRPPHLTQTILNYTGGFKSTIPILTQIASLTSIQLTCLYETAPSLLPHPLIPITLPPQTEQNLLWAGQQNPLHPDILTTSTIHNIDPAERLYYQQNNNTLQLSTLGRAIQILLQAKKHKVGK